MIYILFTYIPNILFVPHLIMWARGCFMYLSSCTSIETIRPHNFQRFIGHSWYFYLNIYLQETTTALPPDKHYLQCNEISTGVSSLLSNRKYINIHIQVQISTMEYVISHTHWHPFMTMYKTSIIN